MFNIILWNDDSKVKTDPIQRAASITFQTILDDLRKRENDIKMILDESKKISHTASSLYSSWNDEFLARFQQVCFPLSIFYYYYFYFPSCFVI